MTPLKGHFDGTAIVLDEPATLVAGQPVHVVVIAPAPAGWAVPGFVPHVDASLELMAGGPLDERDALHVDPLDRVPDDFVREPGSGRGEVRLADDFDVTPEGFEDYL